MLAASVPITIATTSIAIFLCCCCYGLLLLCCCCCLCCCLCCCCDYHLPGAAAATSTTASTTHHKHDGLHHSPLSAMLGVCVRFRAVWRAASAVLLLLLLLSLMLSINTTILSLLLLLLVVVSLPVCCYYRHPLYCSRYRHDSFFCFRHRCTLFMLRVPTLAVYPSIADVVAIAVQTKHALLSIIPVFGGGPTWARYRARWNWSEA